MSLALGKPKTTVFTVVLPLVANSTVFTVFFCFGPSKNSGFYQFSACCKRSCQVASWKTQKHRILRCFCFSGTENKFKKRSKTDILAPRSGQPAMLAHVEAMLVTCGAMLATLGAILAYLGAMLAHLGAMLAHLGAHVGPSWSYVGPTWSSAMLSHLDPS